MRTAKPRIENIEELHLYINVLRAQCLKKEQSLKQNVDYFAANKGKILLSTFNPISNKDGKRTAAKIIEAAVIPAITGKAGGPLAEIILKIAGIAVKKYSEKGFGRLFSKKGKQITLEEIELTEDVMNEN